MPENTHKVPKSQWKRWSPQARRVFNEVYSTMIENQGLFLHPAQPEIPEKFWKTTAWNAAWIAADDGVMKS